MKTFAKVWLGIALIAIGIGVVMLIAAATFVPDAEEMPTYSLQESYTDVKNIDMAIEYGEVRIENGSEFSIDAVNLPEDGIESYVSDGTWTIRVNGDNYVSIFGQKMPPGNIFHWGDYLTPRITITLPENFIAGTLVLSVGAGNVKAEEINAAEGSFNVAAGRLTIDELTIGRTSKYTIGAGQMRLKQVNAKDITVVCSIGSILIEGTMIGDNDITCEVGNIRLNLTGREEDYSYEVSSALGRVTINDRSYHNVAKHIMNNYESENNFSLNCEIGNISVDFN